MKDSLLAGALLLTFCALCSALDYDTPPLNIQVIRPGWPFDFGEYGVAMDVRSPVVLTCTAQGRPAPTFRWEKDGVPVDTSDPRVTVVDGVLNIADPTEADEGKFQCFAENEYGTAMSPRYQTMYVYQDNFAEVKIYNWFFNESEEALIPCGAPPGAPDPTIYWSEKNREDARLTPDSRIIFTADGGDLFFANIKASDAGYYHCYAENPVLGNSRRGPRNVITVDSRYIQPRAATIKELPDQEVGLRTQRLVIKCVASGYPTPEISWYKDGVEITNDGTISLEKDNQELTFAEVGFEHAGTYECRASNEENRQPAKKRVQLTVLSAPYFVTPPKDKVVAPGEVGQISCDAGGIPEPDLEWLQNGAPIDTSVDSPYSVNGDTININGPQEGQSTVFQCVLNNDHGEKIGSYTITVLAIPATISEPPTANIVESEDSVITLRCVTFGSPTPTVEWEKDGVQIVSGGRFTIMEEGEGEISTLEVADLVFEDGGDYTCHALNSVGNSNATSHVLIRLPTDANLVPPEQSVYQGSSADFTCDIKKDDLADPTITWFFNDAKINLNKKGSEYTLLGDNTLRVVAAKSSHTGTFECVVTTMYDSDNSSAELIVQAVPDPPYNLEVEVSGVQANLEWTEPSSNNAEIRSYTIQWRTQHNTFPEPEDPNLAPWDFLREISASSTSETIQLGNFLEYSFRVIATNEVGDSALSDPVTGDMTDPAPPDASSMPRGNVTAAADQPGKLTINWNEVHPYYHNGPDFQYVVKWKPEGEDDWRYEYIADWRQTSFEIDGDEYQNIEYSVGVRNSEDAGPEPDVETGTTGQGEPSAAPSNVQLEALGPNEIRVSWDPVPEGDINGELKHYKIYCTPVNAKDGEITETCDSSCAVGGLEAFTTYSVEVAVVNALMEGPRSDPVTVTTEEGVPSVAEIQSIESTSYRLAVTWTPPAKENGVHLGYNLYIIGSKGDEIVFAKNETVDNTEQTMFKFEEAEPDTTYEVALTAFTKVGDSIPSKDSVETGVAGAPPKPGRPVLDDADVKHLNLTWPLVGEDDPKPDEVRACYKVEDAEEDCTNTDWVDVLEEDKIHVHPLEEGTAYVVFLEYKNEAGANTGPSKTFRTTGKEPKKGGGGQLQSWFIIVICIIVLLLVILLIICILKSQKGGKYNVSDKENALKDESAPLKNNDGFAEFNNDTEFPDDMEGSQDSLASNPDDDGDSLKEYADDEDPSKFNEDGSFVEEYHDPKPRSTDVREGGTSTFV